MKPSVITKLENLQERYEESTRAGGRSPHQPDTVPFGRSDEWQNGRTDLTDYHRISNGSTGGVVGTKLMNNRGK